MSRSCAGTLALWVALLSGCQLLPDVELARGLFESSPRTEIPVFVDEPPAVLPPVGGLAAVAGELRAVPLRWEPLLDPDVSGYVIERALSAKDRFERVGAVAGRHRTRWLDRGTDLRPKHGARDGAGDLGDGKTYLYRVRAFDDEGRLGPAGEGPPVEARTAAAPEPPPGFQAFSHLPRRVAVRWDPSPDPNTRGYVVTRSPTARGEFETLALLDGRFTTTYVDRNLGDLRVFYYRIAGRNGAGGIGEPSKAQRAVTKPEPLPPIGLGLVAQEVGRNTLAWAPNVETDLVTYRVLRRRASGRFEPFAEVPAATTQVVDGEVGAAEALEYALVAIDRDALESARSEPLPVLGVAYGLEAAVTAEGVRLVWKDEVQATLAETRILRVGALRSQEIGRSASPHFLDDQVEPDQRLRYQLVGIRPDGSSAPPSAIVEVSIPSLEGP